MGKTRGKFITERVHYVWRNTIKISMLHTWLYGEKRISYFESSENLLGSK